MVLGGTGQSVGLTSVIALTMAGVGLLLLYLTKEVDDPFLRADPRYAGSLVLLQAMRGFGYIFLVAAGILLFLTVLVLLGVGNS
jgi:hypothetical protein